jgi:hypothetical protein
MICLHRCRPGAAPRYIFHVLPFRVYPARVRLARQESRAHIGKARPQRVFPNHRSRHVASLREMRHACGNVEIHGCLARTRPFPTNRRRFPNEHFVPRRVTKSQEVREALTMAELL